MSMALAVYIPLILIDNFLTQHFSGMAPSATTTSWWWISLGRPWRIFSTFAPGGSPWRPSSCLRTRLVRLGYGCIIDHPLNFLFTSFNLKLIPPNCFGRVLIYVYFQVESSCLKARFILLIISVLIALGRIHSFNSLKYTADVLVRQGWVVD